MRSVQKTLWVDHEWPASGIGDDDSVVDAEVVDRKSSDLPCSDLHRITQGPVQGKRRRARNLLLNAQCVPLRHTVLHSKVTTAKLLAVFLR